MILRAIATLLLVASCQRHEQWRCSLVNQQGSKSCRALHRSIDPIYGIDVEIIKTHGEIVTYLQINSGRICSDDGEVEVVLDSPLGSQTLWVHPQEGNQRIRLSRPLQTALISSLSQGHAVTLSVELYCETIPPHSFEKVLKKLKRTGHDLT